MVPQNKSCVLEHYSASVISWMCESEGLIVQLSQEPSQEYVVNTCS